MKDTVLKVIDLPDKMEGPDVRPLVHSLSDMVNGRITSRKLTEICLLWSYHYVFEDGGYLPEMEPYKPQIVKEYDRLTKVEKKNQPDESRSKILETKMKWLNERDSARIKNHSNYDWLERMYKYFDWKEQFNRREQIKKRMELYNEHREKSHI